MVGAGIKKIRIKNNLTQKDLADKIGVSRQALCMWESDKRELKASTLKQIAKILNITIDDLIKHSVSPKQEGEMATKKKKQKVNFELSAPGAKKVLLTGSFLNWDTNGVPMKKKIKGLWSIGLDVEPGRYEYKFIVDNQWVTDPSNKNLSTSGLGTQNSVVEVGV